jgi:hypothetical protein
VTTDSAMATTGSRGWRRVVTPSFGDIVFLMIFSVAVALGANLTHRDGDLARHLRIGASIIEHGQLPFVDIYSYTMPGVEMVPYEWLSEAAFAAAERLFGFDGVGLLTAILIALPWLILYRWLIRGGASVAISIGLSLLGAGASMIHWAARPHIFSWLFVVIWVIALEDFRKGKRRQLWFLMALNLVWVNTHGAFIVGYILIAIYLLGGFIDRVRYIGPRSREDPRERHLILVLLGSVAVSLANPAGLRGAIHPVSHLLGDGFVFEFTREYTSPDFHNPMFWPFLAIILLSMVSPVRWNATTILLIVSWTALALYGFRNIPLYALIITPVLAFAWSRRQRPARASQVGERFHGYMSMERNVMGGSLSVVLVIVTLISMTRSPGSSFEFSPDHFPKDAVARIGGVPPGQHIFNQFAWGGYLIYCCHPEIPVFIDGQTDHYGPDLTREYDEAIRGRPSWREVFAKYDVDWVLISPNTALAQILAEAADWSVSYRDDVSVVFVPG